MSTDLSEKNTTILKSIGDQYLLKEFPSKSCNPFLSIKSIWAFYKS